MSTLVIRDFNEIFKSDPNAQVLSCQEGLTQKKLAKEYIQKVFAKGADISFMATCGCGEKGNFYEGSVCPKCGEPVRSPFAGELSYRLWVELPTFAPPVLQPAVYRVIDNWLGSSGGTRILDKLLGAEGDLPEDLLSWYTPGWQSFHEQFDNVIGYFLNDYKPLQRASSRHRNRYIPEFINKFRPCVFIEKLPILDSTLHLMTSDGDLNYTDDSAVQAIQMIVDISTAQYQYDHGITPKGYVDKAMSGIYTAYQEYVNRILRDRLIGHPAKKGCIRRETMGFRAHFSFRGVITPIASPHKGDELHMPWLATVTCMKLEILNCLIHRKGMTLEDALSKFSTALMVYDKDIADILEVLIMECPYKGLPVIFNRNPSMRLGAIQLLFVTKVLPNSHCIGISPLVLKAPNADLSNTRSSRRKRHDENFLNCWELSLRQSAAKPVNKGTFND